MIKIGTIAIDLGANDFMLPYLERELNPIFNKQDQEEDAPSIIEYALRILSDIDNDSLAAESAEFMEACKEVPVLVLCAPNIIGTGMNGFPGQIAQRIYKGIYVHTKGNESQMSVIHASEVARAAKFALGAQGMYTLTDNTSPKIEDVANALAYRIDNKHLISLSPKLSRIWLGKQFFTDVNSNHLSENTFCQAFPDFKPASTLDYLYNHVYDENSL